MQRVTMSQALATAVQASKESDVIKVQWILTIKSLSPSLFPLSNDLLALKKQCFKNEMHDSIYSVL